MSTPTKTESKPPRTRESFRNQEAYEQYMIGLAYNLVEQRLLDGTATSQETVHFLRMGSAKERRAARHEEMEIELMETKKAVLESQQKVEELYVDAINAVKSYASPVTMGGPDAHE